MNPEQLNILDVIEAERRADEGLNRSLNKADFDYPQWRERCWQLFLKWLDKKPVDFFFMVETFREDCIKWNKIEMPQSSRAFGFISRRAVSQNLIRSAGKAKTKSVKSHSANAEVWQKV